MSLPLFAGQKQQLLDDIATAMRSVGYTGDLLVTNAEYNDVLHDKNGTIELAGFARIPQDYRNACIGIATSDNGNGGERQAAKHRALGAPLFFALTDYNISRWKITERGKPQHIENIEHTEIFSAFTHNADAWNPERIYRVKVGGDFENEQQLDFFDVGLMPLLEGMIHRKFDRLLREVFQAVVNVYAENNSKPNYEEIYRIIFRLIVAKVMKDRGHAITQQDDAITIVQEIENYYKPLTNVTIDSPLKQRVIDVAWNRISRGFQFQNLSVDDLAFVYESSLVTPETRKLFGTHSTPPRIAEYIVRKLPIEEVPVDERFVLEPCAGHGAFLVPALRRLRDLLPPSFTLAERHKYLTEKLTGIEIDSFAVEACWSRLVLADYPQRNGWNLIEKDVFEDNLLLNEAKKARILFCNPPFEDFTSAQQTDYKQFHNKLLTQKPAEILRQILQYPPHLLGLVLPRRFESGAAYRQFHRQLAETYDSVELVAVPEIFNFSDSTPTLVMATGRREHRVNTTVLCRRVEESEKRSFLKGEFEPSAAKTIFTSVDYSKPDFSLWVAPLSRIWTYLGQKPKLKTIAEIHIGLQWNARPDKTKKERKEVSPVPKEGYVKGYVRVSESLRQYRLINHQYLSSDPDDLAVANTSLWNEKKVVFSYARLGRGGWRLGAVADDEGLLFTKRFFGVWVSDNVSIYAVAALLNSPLANAYVFSHTAERDNHARIVREIPLPSKSVLLNGGGIDRLSRTLHALMKRGEYESAKTILLEIDAEILRQYDLPPYLERELLDLFQNVQRPVPFNFTGYYPKDFTAYLPLSEVISPEFREAQNTSLFDRITIINDEEVSEAMAYIRGEHSDEEDIPS